MKRAILIVAFGTGAPGAEKPFQLVDAKAREAFPGEEIRWAFTSRFIRAKLVREKRPVDSPEAALARLSDERYTHAAVLSLHVMPGEEFHRLYRNVGLFAQMTGDLRNIVVAPPLISSTDDMMRVARALVGRLPPGRRPEDAVILAGHGNRKHPADVIYPAMNYIFQNIDPNIHVGTVSGYPALADILPKLEKTGSGRVYLMPFMAVAGEHIRKDMAGDGPESWKSILVRNGFTCEVCHRGLTEYPEVVDIWLDHLREAFCGHELFKAVC